MHLKCGNILIKLSDAVVFGIYQELQVLAFFLELSQCTLPFDLRVVSVFFDGDDVVVELVVLLGNSFVFSLERNKGLCIKRLIMLNHTHLVFLNLVGFSCFQEVVEEPLD